MASGTISQSQSKLKYISIRYEMTNLLTININIGAVRSYCLISTAHFTPVLATGSCSVSGCIASTDCDPVSRRVSLLPRVHWFTRTTSSTCECEGTTIWYEPTDWVICDFCKYIKTNIIFVILLIQSYFLIYC